MLTRIAALMLLTLGAGALRAGESKPITDLTAPGNHESLLAVGTLKRDFWYHVPVKYSKSTATPLLIVLPYGCGRLSFGDDYSHFMPLSDEHGFIMVTAESSRECGCWAPYMNCDPKLEPKGSMAGKVKAWADEAAYFSAVIDEMEKNFNIDKNRVFICGSSGGGLMTYRLSVLIADRITAAGIACGNFVWRNEYEQTPIPTPARPVSIIAFHGDADKNVSYGHSANANITVWSAHESTGFWVKFNGCDATPQKSTVPAAQVHNAKVESETWIAGKGDATVALYTRIGGGHEFPGYAPPMMWDFFMKEADRRFPK